jgi:hypothetical protein
MVTMARFEDLPLGFSASFSACYLLQKLWVLNLNNLGSVSGVANGNSTSFHLAQYTGSSRRSNCLGTGRVWHPTSPARGSSLPFTLIQIHRQLCDAPDTFNLLLFH